MNGGGSGRNRSMFPHPFHVVSGDGDDPLGIFGNSRHVNFQHQSGSFSFCGICVSGFKNLAPFLRSSSLSSSTLLFCISSRSAFFLRILLKRLRHCLGTISSPPLAQGLGHCRFLWETFCGLSKLRVQMVAS